MNEWGKENSELNIEDILKEFGDAVPVQEEPEEDIRIWGEEVPEIPAASQEVPQDTVRLDDITRVIKSKTAVSEDTIAFTPVGQEEEEEYIFTPPAEPETEPYSEEWEPEYEQPIGEYVPQEPIVFRPKSRLKELKKKLIAGPEKRYYELTEIGFGKLQLAIFLCGLIALLSVVSTGFYALGNVPEDRMRLMVFGQLLGLLLTALLGSYQLMEGFSDLVRGRFSLNTLLLFSLVACIADGIVCLAQVRVPCCAPFGLNMTMSLWSAYHKRSTELGQMDTMRRASRLDSIVLEEDLYNEKSAFLRSKGQVEDFMDTYRAPAKPEKRVCVYAIVALFISLGIGIAAGVMQDIPSGVRFFSASLLISVPATAYIAVSRPMAILERRLHKLGAVLCGWDGVTELNARAVFPLKDEDLFPSGSVKLNGLKFYGSRNPDQVVAYGTAVIVADGGCAAPLFTQLLESRNGYHYEVQALRRYPNGGIGGVVNDEAVLVGSLAFMREMGVEMAEGNKMSQAIYVAVDGVLNGVFAITYSKTKPAAMGLTTLCSYRRLSPVMATRDFLLTEEFIRNKFGVNTRRMEFPERSVRVALADSVPDEEAPALALITQEGLAGAAYCVTGARALRKAANVGVAVQMFGGIFGLMIMLALTIVGAGYLLTPANLLLYELIWMIPGLLITEWTRSV